MNIFKIVGVIFLLVGLGAMSGGGITAKATAAFLAAAAGTEGTITDVVASRDSDGDVAWFPVVTFTDRTGAEVSFRGSSSTSSSSVGRRVKVRYIPGSSDQPRIDSFLGVWGLPFFLTVFGALFTGLGTVALVLGIRSGWTERDSHLYTRELIAKISDIMQDRSVSVNGRHPYRIVAQVLDPDTNLVREFRSKAIWYDPREFVKQETVTVKCHPHDPRKYYVDTGFLPGKA